MSYLGVPRINFAGLFEADVNTVNNDVRNFATDVFEPRFQTRMHQTPSGATEYNGWWNPAGSNRFSLYDCVVTGGADSGGALAPAAVPAWSLVAQFDRTAAKIIDLDPQFQMASALWGLRLALVEGDETILAGSFVAAPFRDLFFGRLSNAAGKPVGGSNGASARFTGVLEDLSFGATADASPLAKGLKQAAGANGGRLSFSLITYGYRVAGPGGGFFGSVIGSIGPWLEGEPLSFAPGRRFSIDANSPNAPFASASNVGYLTALTSAANDRLSLDFGVSLPLQLGADGAIHPQDLGPLTVAVAKTPDTVSEGAGGITVTAGVTEGQALTPDQYEVIGVVADYASAAWLRGTGGVLDVQIPQAARALLADHPLLLLVGAPAGAQKVAIRECLGGFWARADDFIQRIDAAESGWVSSEVDIWAMQWGQPWANAPLAFSIPPVTGQGDTGDPNEVKPPQADVPANNVPLSAIFVPPTATAGPDGKAHFTYWAANPGNPRGYIDGQVYQFNYGPAVNGASPPPTVEVIAAHVRDAFVPPATPSWETDVRPVLVQYSNLYPIMSHGLFSLADFTTVSANARLLRLAFTLPQIDPNYMPATRDLSAGKLRMIVEWLASYLPEGAAGGYGAIPQLPVGVAKPPGGPAPAAQPAAAPIITPEAASRGADAVGPGVDGKTAALRGFLRNAARRGPATGPTEG